MLATASGGRHPCRGAFADRVALELGERRHDVKHQLAARRVGVNPVLECHKALPFLTELRDEVGQEAQRAPQSV